MKKSALTIILLAVFYMLSAQTTNHINYQAVIRNNSGQIISNQTVKLRISILQGSATGTNVYSETHTIQTTDYGLINIEIGGGTLVSGNYSSINWGSNSSFLKLELDANNTGSFAEMGTTELLAVPYALYAKSSGVINEADPIFVNSPANGITSIQVTNWSTAYSWGNHSGLYRSLSWAPSWDDVTGKPTFANVATSGSYSDLSNQPTNIITLSSPPVVGDMLYFNGTNWVVIPKGENGKILTLQEGIPSWQSMQSISLLPANVTAEPATSIQTTKATLNGTVNPNGFSTTIEFEYSLANSNNYHSLEISPIIITGSTSSNVSITNNFDEFTPNTAYKFRLKASNAIGVSYSNEMNFNTIGNVPTVSILTATNITSYTALLNGTVNANYLSTTVSFQYGTTTSYGTTVTASQSPITGSISTNVSASINELLPGTIYHYRIVATNSIGSSYSDDMTFTTIDSKPTALTTEATFIKTNGALLNGVINANNLSTSISFEYGLTTSYGNTVTASQSPILGSIDTSVSALISGLTDSTTYHYRVIATNLVGTTIGNDATFTTLGNKQISDFDNNVYNTITIGSQVWMKENLKVVHYRNGDEIQEGVTVSIGDVGKYCWYLNNLNYKNTYGALYNFYAVTDSRNLCPNGWHVPTDADWTSLETYLGGSSTAGGKLKESGTTHWVNPNTGADNSSLFTAVPTGYYKNETTGVGFWGGGRDTAYWWSSTTSLYGAWGRLVRSGSASSYKKENEILSKSLSVRCIKD